MTDTHISDDRLIDLCVNRSAERDETAHVSACGKCAARQSEIAAILSELDDAATVAADVAFPTPRLERQHARILNRVEEDGRPGEILNFPAARPAMRLLTPSRPRVRWAAAAAAAAFVAGLMTGHLTHDFTFRKAPAPIHIIATEAGSAPLRAVSTTFSEDEFLGQVELATSNSGPAALRPLDAMTPRVR